MEIRRSYVVDSKDRSLAPVFGCHVALTGGLLYKDGPRKDLDILFYRIRQVEEIAKDGLLKALAASLGMHVVSDHGWVVKMLVNARSVDAMFPELAYIPNVAISSESY
jgi:hypothetical protein